MAGSTHTFSNIVAAIKQNGISEVEPDNIQHNLSTAGDLEATSEDVKLVVLPEYCWTAFADARLAHPVQHKHELLQRP